MFRHNHEKRGKNSTTLVETQPDTCSILYFLLRGRVFHWRVFSHLTPARKAVFVSRYSPLWFRGCTHESTMLHIEWMCAKGTRLWICVNPCLNSPGLQEIQSRFCWTNPLQTCGSSLSHYSDSYLMILRKLSLASGSLHLYIISRLSEYYDGKLKVDSCDIYANPKVWKPWIFYFTPVPRYPNGWIRPVWATSMGTSLPLPHTLTYTLRSILSFHTLFLPSSSQLPPLTKGVNQMHCNYTLFTIW